MYIGTERLPMAATAVASNDFWLGCAVDIRCGSVVFTLDSPAAAHRELPGDMRNLLVSCPLDSSTVADRGLSSETKFMVAVWYLR